MLLSKIFNRFVEETPVCVAARAVLEAALNPAALDELFQRSAQRQYQHELLFSTCVDLMSLVVSRTHRSINAAYQASPAEVGVALTSLYAKLANVEATTSAALVRHTADLADEIAGTYRGMMIAIPKKHWLPLAQADTHTLAKLLVDLAQKARLHRYKKSPRGPKKPKPRRSRFAKEKHIATSRLLAREKHRT
jgi:hypothetical protein